MTSHDITLVSEATPCKHSDLTQHSSHLVRCSSDARTIEGYIRGTGMSVSSQFVRSSPASQLLSRSSTSQS
jgi:hypothetical protein